MQTDGGPVCRCPSPPSPLAPSCITRGLTHINAATRPLCRAPSNSVLFGCRLHTLWGGERLEEARVGSS